MSTDPASSTREPSEPGQQQAADSTTASTVAAIRNQQRARRRAGDAAAPPTIAALASSSSSSLPQPARGRVQQGAAADAGSSTSLLRSRLMPQQSSAAGLSHQQHGTPAQGDKAAPNKAPGLASQLFSVFTNPLSSLEAHADSAAAAGAARPTRSRAAASLPAAADSPRAQEPALQQQQHENQNADVPGGPAAAAAGVLPASAGLLGHQTAADAAANTADTSNAVSAGAPAGAAAAVKQQQESSSLQQTYCFEVHAAASEPEQIIDYNGHDQQHTLQRSDGQMQQDSGCIQQYVYDEDTGQLVRTGEGAEATRFGRHYLEDVHTGEFFPLTPQHSGGCWSWLRQWPRQVRRSLFGGADAQEGLEEQQQLQQQQQEPGFLLGLSEFLDSVGSGMSALGLFAQGLAGGLALLCLFMTYIQYATAGRAGFLAFYSPQAEMINRTFFTLISISLVAAASQNAYDKLGHFTPRHLRLGLVDCLVMLLYFLAYTCNLLATPLDDQFAAQAHANPAFYTQPLPPAFEGRLPLWHVLNLIRVSACGLAWVLVCYRSNHFVMLRVFEARRADQALREGAGTGGHTISPRGGGVVGAGVGVQHAPGAGGPGAAAAAGDSPRRLQRLGSGLGSSFVERGGGGGLSSSQQQRQQQQWAVHTKRYSVAGVVDAVGF